jgi:hypothetical protein
MRSRCILLLTALALSSTPAPRAAGAAQSAPPPASAPTITLTAAAPAALIPGAQFHATLVVTSTETITVGVTLDRQLELVGVTFPHQPALRPEPDRIELPLPAGESTVVVLVRVRDDATPGPADLLAYCLDPLIRVETSVTIAWRSFLPAIAT